MIRYQNNCEGMEEIIGPVLTIVDIGDHRRQLTITNDVEYVVHMLWLSCALADQARLCYIDSENIRCEIRHDQGKIRVQKAHFEPEEDERDDDRDGRHESQAQDPESQGIPFFERVERDEI